MIGREFLLKEVTNFAQQRVAAWSVHEKITKHDVWHELLSLIWIAESEAELLSLNFSVKIWILQSESELFSLIWIDQSESELFSLIWNAQSESELFSLIWIVQSESELLSLIWIESDFLNLNWVQIYCHLFSFWLYIKKVWLILKKLIWRVDF